MKRNKGRFRPLPSRLSSAAWCGIFGQSAGWLTESTALIDSERLRRHFAAYWGLYSPVLGITCHQTASRRENKLRSKSSNDGSQRSACVEVAHRCLDRPITSRHCTRNQIRHRSQERCVDQYGLARRLPLLSALPRTAPFSMPDDFTGQLFFPPSADASDKRRLEFHAPLDEP